MASIFGGALGGVVGGAVVRLVLDRSQFEAGLAQARGETQAAAGGMDRFGGAAKAAFAVAGVAAIKFGADSFKAFTEAQQVMAQTGAVLESTGGVAGVTADEVTNLASSLRDMSGVDDEAIQASENLLLTFRNIHNEAGRGNDVFNQTTRAILDMATAMNQGAIPSQEELAQTTIQVGKAMNDPIQGMTALRRVGVGFSDSQVELITHLQETGDLMGAQKIILRELTAEFGGAAEAAGHTLAGQLDIAKSKLGDFKEAIGGFLGSGLLLLTGNLHGAASMWVELGDATDGAREHFAAIAQQFSLNGAALGHLTAQESAARTEMQHLSEEQAAANTVLSASYGAASQAAFAAEHLADANRAAADQARNLYAAQLSLVGGLLGLQGASLSAEQATRSLKDANAEVNRLQEQGKRGTVEYKDAILAQRQAELQAVQSRLSLVQAAQAYIRENGGSNASTHEAIGLIRQYGRDAGLTGGQIRDLIGDVTGLIRENGRVPSSVQTHYLAIGLEGNLAALAQYNQYLAGLNGKQVYITVHTNYVETGARPHGGIQ